MNEPLSKNLQNTDRNKTVVLTVYLTCNVFIYIQFTYLIKVAYSQFNGMKHSFKMNNARHIFV